MRMLATLDTAEFRRSVQLIRHGVRAIVHESVQSAGDIAVIRARQTTAFKDKSGLLRRRINRSNVRWDGAEAFVWFSSPTQYSSFVEDGTKDHEIWPKEGYGFMGPLKPSQGRREITDIGTYRVALRWFVGDRTVFARMVHHPGTSPCPYMVPAAEYAGEWLREILERRFVGLQSVLG